MKSNTKKMNLLIASLIPVAVGMIQFYFWRFISPFVWFLFFPTVFFTARLLGFWAGILSTVVSTAIVWYFFIPTQYSWAIDSTYHFYTVIIFMVMGYFFSDSQEKLKKANKLLEDNLDETKRSNIEITRLYKENLALDEIKFATLANSLPQIVWATNADGSNIFFNDEWMRYTGLSLAESLGAGWNKPFHPDDQAKAWAAWENAVTNRNTYSLECRLRRSDGEYRWWLIRGVPVMTLEGKIDKWFGTCTDINDIKTVENKLRLEEEKLRAAFETLDDGILVLDNSKNFIQFNMGLVKFLKYKNKSEFPNYLDEFSKLVSLSKNGEAVPLDEWPSRQALKGNKANNLEYTVNRIDNGESWLGSYSYAPILDASGKVDGAVIIARDITEKRKTELEIQSYLQRLEDAMQDTLEVLAKTVDMRDPYTAGHQTRVGALAQKIALEIGFSAKNANSLRLIGLIHDIGKIGVPAELLSKPNKLSQIEYELIKTHVQIGYDILKNINFLVPVAQTVYQHHERMDGSGYPNHLTGPSIIIEARIIAVADVVEAMSSHRPYRPALGIEPALKEIEDGKGTKYDPIVVDACLKLFREDKYQFPTS